MLHVDEFAWRQPFPLSLRELGEWRLDDNFGAHPLVPVCVRALLLHDAAQQDCLICVFALPFLPGAVRLLFADVDVCSAFVTWICSVNDGTFAIQG